MNPRTLSEAAISKMRNVSDTLRQNAAKSSSRKRRNTQKYKQSLAAILYNWNKIYCNIADMRDSILTAKYTRYFEEKQELEAQRNAIIIEITNNLMKRQEVINNARKKIPKRGKQQLQDNDNDLYSKVDENIKEHPKFQSVDKEYRRLNQILEKIKEKKDDIQSINRLKELLEKLNKFEGQDEVKNTIADIIISFLTSGEDFLGNHYLNFLLLGPAGVGKTEITRNVAKVLGEMGLLCDGSIDIVSRANLVGQYLGETALKTESVLKSNIENCLVIDEAYLLGTDEYGRESIGTLINFLDKHKGQIIVFALGYEKEMEESFIQVNEGMARRFPYKMILQSYKENQLKKILLQKLNGINYDDDSKSESKNKKTIRLPQSNDFTKLLKSKCFKNQAGDMENLALKLKTKLKSSNRYEIDENMLMAASYDVIKNMRYDDETQVNLRDYIAKTYVKTEEENHREAQFLFLESQKPCMNSVQHIRLASNLRNKKRKNYAEN